MKKYIVLTVGVLVILSVIIISTGLLNASGEVKHCICQERSCLYRMEDICLAAGGIEPVSFYVSWSMCYFSDCHTGYWVGCEHSSDPFIRWEPMECICYRDIHCED